MVKSWKEPDGKLRHHVAAIGCIDFAIGSEADIVLTFPNGDARIVALFEVNDVGVLVMFVDREFGTNLELMRINQDAAVERVGRPEKAAAHGNSSEEKQDHGELVKVRVCKRQDCGEEIDR